MQIEKRYKIEQAAGKDLEGTREPLNYIHVADGEAVACNGCIMASVPCVVGSGDVAGPITPESLQYARKHTKGDGATLYLRTLAEVTAVDSSEMPRSMKSSATEKGEQLDLLRVANEDALPANAIDAIPEQDVDDIILTLDPELLKKLADALGSPDSVTLRMRPDADCNTVLRSIRVEVHGDTARGAIMPRGDTYVTGGVE